MPLSFRGRPQRQIVSIDGRPASKPGDDSASIIHEISPHYLRALGVALTRGRDFTPADREAKVPVAIVNEAFVRHYLAAEDPIGKRVTWANTTDSYSEVV